jgi:hypothetical protein
MWHGPVLGEKPFGKAVAEVTRFLSTSTKHHQFLNLKPAVTNNKVLPGRHAFTARSHVICAWLHIGGVVV